MNPTLQQFIPGLGQQITPEDLANGLQMFKGQGATLGNAPTLGNAQAMEQEQAANLAQMMEQYRSAQGDQQMAQELMRPQYAQNSGGLGALAMIAQTYAGKRMRKKADESASEYAGRIFEEEQRQAAAQAEAAAKAQEAQLARQWAREDQRDETKAQREERLAMLRIDAADRRAAQTAEARIAAARIGASAAGQGGGAQVLSADEAKAIGLTPGTVAQRDRNGRISILQAPQQAGENPKAVAANVMFDALDNLESGYKSGRYGTGPLEGRLRGLAGDSDLQVMDSDIATVVSSLRAIQRVPGSGAESDKELELLLNQAPTRMTDEAASLEIIERLRKKANQYAGSFGAQSAAPSASPAAPSAPTQRAVNPQTGEALILVNGQWVPEK